MAIKEIVFLIVIIVSFMDAVDASGYGGGHGQSYMVPGGGSKGRKWKIRAKGKGMQNMMKIPSYKHEEKKEQEIVYYPVPVYSKSKKYHDDKEDEYESKQQIKIIPMYRYGKSGGEYGGYGKDDNEYGGYGKGGDEYGGYGGYGGGGYH